MNFYRFNRDRSLISPIISTDQLADGDIVIDHENSNIQYRWDGKAFTLISEDHVGTMRIAPGKFGLLK